MASTVWKTRGPNRTWTDAEMYEMMDKINRGHTYQDVTDGTHVPISTLWTRVKGKFQGQMRPKIGSPGIFPPEVEADFALYLKHCSLLRIPRTRKMFQQDVLYFTQYKRITFPKMPEDGPGRTCLDRFAKEWPDIVKFYTKGEIFQIQNDPITMRDWVHDRDYYTRIQLLTKYLPSRRYIFVMEVETLTIEASNKQEFVVIIMYNAEGELLIPFVIHKHHQIPEVLTKHFYRRVQFFPTEDGKLDLNCLCIAVYVIELFLIAENLQESPIMYISPQLSNQMSLFGWDICNRHNYVLQTIPNNIYRYLKMCNMGVFEKLTRNFKKLAKEEFPDRSKVCLKFHFFDILWRVMEASRWNAHLRNTCNRLRIVHVSPEVAQVEEEVDEDLAVS